MIRDDLAHAVRERLVRLPVPYANHYGVVPLPPPEDAVTIREGRISHEHALMMLGRIQAITRDMLDPYVVSRTLSRREAVSSSSIEGTNSTLDELLTIEEDDDHARDAAHQVRDYVLTLDRFLPQASAGGTDIFTTELMKQLHREAMRHDPDYADPPGELRETVVWIGGTGNIAYSTYTPPPPDRVAISLEDTATYMRGTGMQVMTQSLVTRMAIAHAHFEAVHPFRDGNGRVGRLLLPMMMAAEGHVPLYLSPYIEANKQAYYDGLKAAQQRLDWDPLIGFLSDAIIGTVEELLATRASLQALRDFWLGRRRFRAGSTALRALDLLVDYPVITANRLAARLNVSLPSALAAIDQLVEIGVMTEKTGYQRNRIFVAAEVLAIVNRPFGLDPIID